MLLRDKGRKEKEGRKGEEVSGLVSGRMDRKMSPQTGFMRLVCCK